MVSVHLVPIRPTAATADDAQRLSAALLDDPRPGAAVISAAWHIDETDAAPHDGELAVTLDGMAAGVGLALWAVRSGSWAVLLDPEGNYDKQSALSHITAGERRRARRAPGRLVLPGGGRADRAAEAGREADLRCAEATLQLVATVERRRSADQHAAGRLVEAGASQREAAAELGISQQAVHSRLRHGLWHESRAAAAAVLPLLERLAADPEE
ncbi:hypothetical protein [Micrococcus luteus]|uniref:hypothetical protein n=1 Tax=Micrococcus luteus TaxID=1270 RepID=UPI000C79A48C|nr:hypothetical protein [Micrococcus luteus]MCV7526356.1 hypothetical protein [Micrococcus luteus]PLA46284.1 hypothetical protein CYJ93_07085 [Micrococcus luteus]